LLVGEIIFGRKEKIGSIIMQAGQGFAPKVKTLIII